MQGCIKFLFPGGRRYQVSGKTKKWEECGMEGDGIVWENNILTNRIFFIWIRLSTNIISCS